MGQGKIVCVLFFIFTIIQFKKKHIFIVENGWICRKLSRKKIKFTHNPSIQIRQLFWCHMTYFGTVFLILCKNIIEIIFYIKLLKSLFLLHFDSLTFHVTLKSPYKYNFSVCVAFNPLDMTLANNFLISSSVINIFESLSAPQIPPGRQIFLHCSSSVRGKFCVQSVTGQRNSNLLLRFTFT